MTPEPTKSATPSDADPENDSETCCKSCGDEYALRDGQEPTKYCDQCAHKIVERLEIELEAMTANWNVTTGRLQASREQLTAANERVKDLESNNRYQRGYDAGEKSIESRLTQIKQAGDELAAEYVLVKTILQSSQELNPSNYTHEEACELNDKVNEAFSIMQNDLTSKLLRWQNLTK